MNEKFYNLKKEKQDAMINASLKIFAQNGYQHASTDLIVKEAGISKGLLFHYFGSKKNLYIFTLEYSARYLILELSKGIDKSETNIFALYRSVEKNKIRMLKNYPYLELFLTGNATEQHSDVREDAATWENHVREAYEQIYEQADPSNLTEGITIAQVMEMTGLCMEGFKSRKYRSGEEVPEQILSDFQVYIDLFEKCMTNREQ